MGPNVSPETMVLKELFKRLNQARIRYCVLRNYHYLPESLNGSDLDILIQKSDIEDFYDIFFTITKVFNGKIIVKYGELTPRICLCGSSEGWWGVQVDVHEGILPYKVLPIMDADFVLQRSNCYNKIYVADDNDAAIVAFLKDILNNRKFKKKYFYPAQGAYKNNPDLYDHQIKKHFGEKFSKKFNNTLTDDLSEQHVMQLSELGRKKLCRGMRNRYKIWKGKLKKLYRFFSPPGFSVAMMGCDGAGKTTVIDRIKVPLSEAVHNALSYEHMRPNLIPNIAQVFGKEKPNKPTTNPHDSNPSGLIGSLLRLAYYSFDYIAGYWLKIYPEKVKKSCIWLFDRYYYDYLLDQYRARLNLPEWLIKLVGNLVPAPDLILCLGANPPTIHSRKPELSLKEVRRQVEKLREFCDTNKRAVWIDTDCAVEESVDKALEAITSRMAARYE